MWHEHYNLVVTVRVVSATLAGNVGHITMVVVASTARMMSATRSETIGHLTMVVVANTARIVSAILSETVRSLVNTDEIMPEIPLENMLLMPLSQIL